MEGNPVNRYSYPPASLFSMNVYITLGRILSSRSRWAPDARRIMRIKHEPFLPVISQRNFYRLFCLLFCIVLPGVYRFPKLHRLFAYTLEKCLYAYLFPVYGNTYWSCTVENMVEKGFQESYKCKNEERWWVFTTGISGALRTEHCNW